MKNSINRGLFKLIKFNCQKRTAINIRFYGEIGVYGEFIMLSICR